MVERLKFAIEKARAERERLGDDASAPARRPAPDDDARQSPRTGSPAAAEQANDQLEQGEGRGFGAGPLTDWSIFSELPIDDKRMERARIVSHLKSDPAYRAFDMLRTRSMRAMKEKDWSRLAITSPTKGAGKTVVSLNLAFSLARQPGTKVLLLDMDLVAPQLTDVIAPETDADIEAFLSGATPAETYLRRFKHNLLIGLNSKPVAGSAELLQSEAANRILIDTIERTQPNIVIFDTSPVLVSDDALNVMANADCAMMVVASGEAKVRDIEESERLVAEWTELLGVVLNKSEETSRESYGYGYGY